MSEIKSNFMRILEEICREHDIRLTSFSGDWGHKLEKNGKTGFIVGYQFGLNLASVKEICQDKVLTYQFLHQAGVPACPHFLLPNTRTTKVPGTKTPEELGAEMFEEYGTLVLKDNYGTGGTKVFQVHDREELNRYLALIHASSYAAALCPFYEIREEYRVVMLDGAPELLIRKDRPYELVNGEKHYLNWKHNLGQGATGVILEDQESLKEVLDVAKAAIRAIPARFASVDVIDTAEGLKVLEINGGVMMEHLAGQSEAYQRKVKAVYEKAILRML